MNRFCHMLQPRTFLHDSLVAQLIEIHKVLQHAPL